MAKARTPRMRAIVVLIAGLLAVAVVWAGTALGGGSSGGTKPPAAPAKSGTDTRHDGKRDGKNCPFEDATYNDSSDL